MNKYLLKIVIIFTVCFVTFGSSSAWIGLIAENGNLLNLSQWNQLVNLVNTKLNQDNIIGTGNINVNNSATGVIISFTGGIASSPIPDITSGTFIVQTNITESINIIGEDFIPNSIVTLPNFPGTINTTSILSKREIVLNITSGSNPGIYDIVVSNNGVLNTQWSGNGENLLNISSVINITGDDINGRQYANGNFASSCNDYISSNGIYDYSGDIGDGYYNIQPDNNTEFMIYCDMTTDGGGWSRIEYNSDLNHQAHFTDGDTSRWLDFDFSLTLTDTQIDAIRNVSTQGKQLYQGSCEGVIHYLYGADSYAYAFGFRYHDGTETAYEQENYPNTNITVTNDFCSANSGIFYTTDFTILDIRVPVINVHSKDNSSTEEFGSELTNNPAWLK